MLPICIQLKFTTHTHSCIQSHTWVLLLFPIVVSVRLACVCVCVLPHDAVALVQLDECRNVENFIEMIRNLSLQSSWQLTLQLFWRTTWPCQSYLYASTLVKPVSPSSPSNNINQLFLMCLRSCENSCLWPKIKNWVEHQKNVNQMTKKREQRAQSSQKRI